MLLRLALIFDAPLYRERAATVLGSLAPFMARYPTGFGRYLAAAEFALSAPKEIALVGEPGAADTQALCAEIFGAFRPNKVVLLRRPATNRPRSARRCWPIAGRSAARLPPMSARTTRVSCR
ncbi:MAG: hypothetical protein U0Z44_08695 [Kouleothrix sp.]